MAALVLTLLGAFLLFDKGFFDLITIPEPYGASFAKIFLRLLHFLAGVAWIGMLYYFNLVNVPLMKKLDGPTKGKVIPELMPRALFWFRWGAVFTVFSGITYYAMYIIVNDIKNAKANGTIPADVSAWVVLGKWLLIVLVAYGIIYAVIQPASGLLNKGTVFAPVVGVIALLMSCTILYTLGLPDMSNKSLSTGIGGGLGIIMFLNVWLIIWPSQKKVIAWTKANAENGTPIPPESAKLARRTFMASRTNAWFSIPMLFFMAASHDYAMFTAQIMALFR